MNKQFKPFVIKIQKIFIKIKNEKKKKTKRNFKRRNSMQKN